MTRIATYKQREIAKQKKRRRVYGVPYHQQKVHVADATFVELNEKEVDSIYVKRGIAPLFLFL